MNRQFLSVSGLTITHLRQVIERMGSMRENELVKLDQTVNSYILKRKECRQQEDNFEAKVRSQLISLEQKNDYLIKELQIMRRGFDKEQNQIHKTNEKWVNQSDEFNEANPYEDLVKELIQQLLPFKKIAQYVDKLQILKGEQRSKEIVASSAQEYFQRVDEILGEEESQLDGYYQDQYEENGFY